MPVIGFLNPAPRAKATPHLVVAFRRGLAEACFVEGKNLAIEYRFTNFRPELLPEAAGDLVRLNGNAIFGHSSRCRCRGQERHDQYSYRCASFGERSSCTGICQESSPPGREYDGNVC